MKHKLLLIYSWIIRTILFFLPDIPFFMRIRGSLYGLGMKQCGKNFQVAHSSILNSLECFMIGDNVYIANFCNLLGNGTIVIENNVIIGPGVIISAGNHVYENGSFRFSKSIPLDVTIMHGSWIAANCTIVGECIFPSESILAANSVFISIKEFKNKSLYAGVPAKLVKELNL
ncbi:MAG: acyltransferase [Bacteroidota bacterium]